MPKTIQMTVKVEDIEVVIPFTLHQRIDISMEKIRDLIPDIKYRDENEAEFYSWAEDTATARHTYEGEYDFAIQPQDPDWVKNIGVPVKFIPIFESAHLAAMDINKSNKQDVTLRIFVGE